MSNVPYGQACARAALVSAALPAEAGHWVAGRITPPSYPFRVEKVTYGLGGGPLASAKCRLDIPHRVRGYVVSGQTTLADGGTTVRRPPAEPTDAGLIAFEVAGGNTADAGELLGADGGVRGRTVTVSLPQPIVLQAGQSLFISLEIAGRNEVFPDGGGALADGGMPPNTCLCMDACRASFDGGSAPRAGVDYWSNAAAEPYAWADMVSDFGFPSLFTLRVVGTPQ